MNRSRPNGLALLVALLALPAAGGAQFEKLPRITTQPGSVTSRGGSDVVLFARAYGAGDLTFQWLRGGVPLPGANEPILRLGSLSAGDAEDYRMVVGNSYGRATSEVARVTVEAVPHDGALPAAAQIVTCAVGYVNVSLEPGFTLVVNPLSLAGAYGGETVSNVLALLPGGMAIYQISQSGFTANAWLGEWREPTAPLPMGEVFFVFNPFDLPMTATLVGAVVEGDLQQTLPAGHCVAASLVPQSGGGVSVLELPAAPGDALWRWDKQAQSYLEFTLSSEGWQPAEPQIPVAEAFVVQKKVSAIWRRVFFLVGFGGCPVSYALPRLPLTTVGQLHFFTYHPDPEFGRVGTVGSGFFGQLYVGWSTNEIELVPVGEPVRFLDGAYGGYVNGDMVTVPGSVGGDVVHAQLRAWCGRDGDSYEAALAAGGFTARSEVVPARTGAPLVDGKPGLPPPPVNSFRTLRLEQVPHFLTQPASQNVPIGHDATLAVSAAGAEPLSYQWQRDGVAIPGAEGPELPLSNLQKSDTGDYSVVVSNAICALNSASARLVVYEPIQIVVQPVDVSAVAGDTAGFEVLATGETPLTYQWRSSAPDPRLAGRFVGATNAALLISNVVDVSEGDYWVEVRSPYEMVASARAHLEVTNYLHVALDTPAWSYRTGGDQAWRLVAVSSPRTPDIAMAGPLSWLQEAWMETDIDGPGVVTFWWTNSAPGNDLWFLIDGAGAARLSGGPGWEQASVALPGGSHRLTWRLNHRGFGGDSLTASVDEVQLRQGVPPTIVQVPSNYWFTPGETVRLDVVAAGDGPMFYQWFLGADPIAFATSDSLYVSPSVAGEPYAVAVSNYFGVATSGPVLLLPRPRLRIEREKAGTLRLVWPWVASQFVLEQNTSLTGPNAWSVISGPVVHEGDECVAKVSASATTNRWFRLRLP